MTINLIGYFFSLPAARWSSKLLDSHKTKECIEQYTQCGHASVVRISAVVIHLHFLLQPYNNIHGNYTVVTWQS